MTTVYDPDKLSRYKPDLIIGSDHEKEHYEPLFSIAPMLLLPFKPLSWQMHLMALAEALELQAVAERWLHYYELKVKAAQHKISINLENETLLVAKLNRHSARVFGANRRKVGKLIYRDLQIRAPKGLESFSFVDVDNIEELNDFNPDHILLLHDFSCPIDKKRFRSLNAKLYYAHTYPWLHYSAIGHARAVSEALMLFAR
ncbi:ABC transporter substrate-binding protein [Paenibacillus dendritiformis]|uniref:Periplasmic binding family protein n=1 Tax=Paenibacillus macerans TaxID=44252 RepID=A0A090ZAP2_PAEMA|nr:ABC transporter substrate-binding protein [Paenibacillus macerans]KFN08349.1 periplasmic binding family protein [Paenibacillus macerans]MBS5912066.1 ABC transporter substrate-binding protein [Paenibacillus macerans]MCY7557695.1 ABC transporter substrate-binding protein [Paenibacillus macerans]MDU5945934.1 ABC transporter substrate-binding protein [Paenibacillus macerans]MDU7472542.1 ABC transporter substrate-binding protein [Paenibacillus macerans]